MGYTVEFFGCSNIEVGVPTPDEIRSFWVYGLSLNTVSSPNKDTNCIAIYREKERIYRKADQCETGYFEFSGSWGLETWAKGLHWFDKQAGTRGILYTFRMFPGVAFYDSQDCEKYYRQIQSVLEQIDDKEVQSVDEDDQKMFLHWFKEIAECFRVGSATPNGGVFVSWE